MLINVDPEVNLHTEISNKTIYYLLDKAKKGVEKYREIMEKIQNGQEYRKDFENFYRLSRRPKEMREGFFEYLDMKLREREENQDAFSICLRDPLEYLVKYNKLEISFASKLLHTLSVDMPIWDSIVTKRHFKIHAPSYKTDNRMNETIKRYDEYCLRFHEFIVSDNGKKIINLFDKVYGDNNFSSTKKIDFVLWADN